MVLTPISTLSTLSYEPHVHEFVFVVQTLKIWVIICWCPLQGKLFRLKKRGKKNKSSMFIKRKHTDYYAIILTLYKYTFRE